MTNFRNAFENIETYQLSEELTDELRAFFVENVPGVFEPLADLIQDEVVHDQLVEAILDLAQITFVAGRAYEDQMTTIMVPMNRQVMAEFIAHLVDQR
jgi:hypothetical protein